MPEKPAPINYPDVFGHITDVERFYISVVEVGIGCRPRVVRAGRPFEVIILVQNVSDAPTDVTLLLQIPEKDALGQRDRFVAGVDRLVIGLNPAEVGYAILPISTLPDTALSSDYVIDLEISVRPLQKPQRIRQQDGGGHFDPRTLNEEAQQRITELQQVRFAPQKRGFRRNNIQVHFGVLAGKVGTPLNIKPGWVSLWTLDNQEDVELLIHKHMEVMWRLLPALKRDRLYPLLLEHTVRRFDAAGYPLTPQEASLVAKLMALLIEYAGPGDAAIQGGSIAEAYNVYSMLKSRRTRSSMGLLDNSVEHAPVPYWTKAFLRALTKDERIANVPFKAIPHFTYEALLHDVIMYSFLILERDTGENLGTPEEMDAYAQQFLTRFKNKDQLDFSYVYLPLVLGGVLVADRSLIGDERLVDVMKALNTLLENRAHEHNDDTDTVFEISEHTIALCLRKYGLLDNR